MTPAELDAAGLDPAHIQAICTEFGQDADVLAVRTADGVRVTMPTRRAAWQASGALGRVGYTAAIAGDARNRNRQEVLITGWSTARLDQRLTELRATMHRLADNPLVTATAAVRRIAALPTSAATPETTENILGESRVLLRRWVHARAGICAPSPPAMVPADTATAMRVRAAASCEQVINDLIDRHTRVAEHAVSLFGSLRQRMNDGRAQNTAVRRAGITFHLSGGSIAQDSAPLMRAAGGAGRGSETRPTRSGDRPSRSKDGPRRGAAREFPASPGATGTAGPAPPASRGGPGGQAFPAARPGRHP